MVLLFRFIEKSFGQLEPYCGSGHIIIIKLACESQLTEILFKLIKLAWESQLTVILFKLILIIIIIILTRLNF